MDTITHGIAGALMAKALFNGDDLFASRPMNCRRIVTWSTMLGAIFPDSDVFRDIISRDDLLVISWHRSVTHSLLCLPLFALLLAALTRWVARWRKWDAPSFAVLTGIYAAGILSHTLLDLVTSFGTMAWSPLRWSRPAWDLIFIVDFTFTGIMLVPQILAWVQERPEKARRRAIASFAIFALAVFVIQRLADTVGAPISSASALLFVLILAAFFLLSVPTDEKVQQAQRSNLEGQDLARTSVRRRWNRFGLVGACLYLGLAAGAHHSALSRVKDFAGLQKLDVQSMGALPSPPSLWRWDGLLRTAGGVYEIRMDLSQKSPFEIPAAADPAEQSAGIQSERAPIEYRFYPEANPNVYIEAAKELPQVQKVLWFDRFPVTRYHEEGGEPIVEFSDMRFPPMGKRRTPSFTYRVRFDPAGKVLEQGWIK
ncbi:MAG TPA: metal-dependent hydrolase [Methylomirabilota bacterium]|nr:metal-dependent hydrolase [Methylomirabilota bacterium]